MEHETALDLSLPKLQTKILDQIASNTTSEIDDHTPSSKRRKLSQHLLEDNSPPNAYISRNGEENDAYLSDDAEQLLPVSFPDIKSQDVGLIKRTCKGVSVCLHDETLWRAFASFGTEMIINRGGRRMFPHIILSIEGLSPHILYSVILEIVPADQRRYKFIHNQWMAMGMADPGPGVQPVTHPDSPNVGSFWMKNRASFSKVRLTNNKESSIKKCSDGNILLLSMHKYKVVIKIREENNTSAKSELAFEFDESAFVAVTAYQNSQITQLKIQNNPFAKAFRDCHNPPFGPKCVSPRKRDSKAKEFSASPSMSQTIYCPEAEFRKPESWSFPYSSLPFRQSGVNMAAFDELCKKAAGRALYPAQYFPWAAMGQHWPFPAWMKETQGLMNSLSNTLSAMTPEVGCMRLPVNPRRSPDNTDSESQQQSNTS